VNTAAAAAAYTYILYPRS